MGRIDQGKRLYVKLKRANPCFYIKSLVFVNSRKGAKDLAEVLSKFQNWSNQPAKLNSELSQMEITTPGLMACLKKGCAWHSAELNANDRHIVEDIFSKSLLGVIVCTSTLAGK